MRDGIPNEDAADNRDYVKRARPAQRIQSHAADVRRVPHISFWKVEANGGKSVVRYPQKTKGPDQLGRNSRDWLRGPDLNWRPSGYEPDELPVSFRNRGTYKDSANHLNGTALLPTARRPPQKASLQNWLWNPGPPPFADGYRARSMTGRVAVASNSVFRSKS